MIEAIIAILILLTAFPIGYLVAYLTRDELVAGRRWFSLVSWTSIIAIFIILLLTEIQSKFPIVHGLMYLAIVSIVCEKLSYRKKFTINR